jgi:hypothetical protein
MKQHMDANIHIYARTEAHLSDRMPAHEAHIDWCFLACEKAVVPKPVLKKDTLRMVAAVSKSQKSILSHARYV